MPLPRPDWLRVLLPIIVRLMPECLQAEKITRGRVIPIENINPINEAQEARNLSREFKRERRTDGRKDSSQVVNLDTAIKCVEESAGKGGLVAKVVRKCCAVLIAGGTGTGPNVTEDIMNPVIKCLRESALRQDTPRNVHRTETHGRPARGHGHGRK
jgi:hypothetical protein